MTHAAFYFPGGYYPNEDPFKERLASVTINALEDAGAQVKAVLYDRLLVRSPEEYEEFRAGILRDVGAGLDEHPDRVTFLGKSLGTSALAALCDAIGVAIEVPADTRMIWQTPVWRSDFSWESAKRNQVPSLHIVGLGDDLFHLPERHSAVPGRTVSIPGADHGLAIPGDVIATLEAWRISCEAIIDFASRRDAVVG